MRDELLDIIVAKDFDMNAFVYEDSIEIILDNSLSYLHNIRYQVPIADFQSLKDLLQRSDNEGELYIQIAQTWPKVS